MQKTIIIAVAILTLGLAVWNGTLQNKLSERLKLDEKVKMENEIAQNVARSLVSEIVNTVKNTGEIKLTYANGSTTETLTLIQLKK